MDAEYSKTTTFLERQKPLDLTMLKRVFFLTVLLIPVAVVAQNSLSGKFKQRPIFKSAKDSIELATLDAMLNKLYKSSSPTAAKSMDSLVALYREKLPAAIVGHRNIYEASKDFPSIESLNRERDKKTITKLSISSKKLKKLPADIFMFENLEEIEIVNCNLRKIQPDVALLKNLRKVSVYNNTSRKPLKLGKNSTVTHLYIHGDNPKSVPKSFKNFEALKKLDLSENNLTKFNNGATRNKNLIDLDFQRNKITLKENNIKPHVKLERLSMQYNKITYVPSSISNLADIKKLTFNYNEITDVAPEINRLQNLEYISFYNNKLTAVPAGIYGIKSMMLIDLFYNQLTKLDERIAEWPALQILYISHNQLSKLPESISKLDSLKEIHAYNNLLTELPSSLCRISNLKVLRINKNLLDELPACYPALSKLEEFDFSDNNIKHFPAEIVNFKELKILAMKVNSWETTEATKSVAETIRSRGAVVLD